jgi:LytR cell envelope-related transcriptional attenuator
MSTPKGTGASRRLRTAGLVLFAVAVIAALLGLVVAIPRGEPAPGESLPPPATAPGTAAARPSVIPYPPPVPSITAEAPVVAPSVAPSVPPDAAGSGPVSGESRRRGEVRVYNNSTIRGLAARAARDLTAAGWTVVEVGNYALGTIPVTTVYYQDGTGQQASAQALGAEFKMRVEPRFAGLANAGPGLIVIVTNNYASP